MKEFNMILEPIAFIETICLIERNVSTYIITSLFTFQLETASENINLLTNKLRPNIILT
jgi:hypothetical protein